MESYASSHSVKQLLQSLEIPSRLLAENLEQLFKLAEPAAAISLTLVSQTIQAAQTITTSKSTSATYPDWPALDGIMRPMTKSWRARVAVITALCEVTKKTRIQIGYIRLDFIDEMIAKGKRSKFWNIDFAQYVLNLLDFRLLGPRENQTDTTQKNRTYIPFPDLSDFFRRFRPPYRSLSQHWKPSINTQKALYNRGVPYEVTTHPAMINGFINNVRNGDIPDGDLNTRYVQYVELKREQMEEIEKSANVKIKR